MPPKTAYFLFSSEHREEVLKELQAQAEEGTKVSAAEVAKALGKKWKELEDAEKSAFKERALQEQQAAEAAGEPGGGGAVADSAPKPANLPASTVRRIVMADQDIKRIVGAATLTIGRSAELLMKLLVQEAMGCAQEAKRKTLRLQDIDRAVARDSRLSTVFKDALKSPALEEARAEGDRAKEAALDKRAASKAAALEESAKKDKLEARPITHFFKKQ